MGPCRTSPQLCVVRQGWGCRQRPLLHLSHPLLVRLSMLWEWHPGLTLGEEEEKEEEEAPAGSGPRVAATQLCKECKELACA